MHRMRFQSLIERSTRQSYDWIVAMYVISSNERIYHSCLPAINFDECTVHVGDIGPLTESDSYLLTAGLSLLMENYPSRLKDIHVLDDDSFRVLELAIRTYYFRNPTSHVTDNAIFAAKHETRDLD